MTDSTSIPYTLAELIEQGSGRQDRHHSSRTRHPRVLRRAARAGAGRGRAARRRRRAAAAIASRRRSPNGLPAIVSFLAASIAGTAAPLNPAYKEDEFRFYLEDTAAKVLILPPEGADDARRAAGDRVPVLGIDVDASGTVSLTRRERPHTGHAAGGGRRRAGAAHERQHRASEARPAEAREPVDLGAERRPQLRAHRRRRVAVRDAAVPRPRPRGLDAGHALERRDRRRAGEIQPALVLARGARLRRHVVLGGADTAPAAARARARAGRRGSRKPGRAPSACGSSVRAAPRCRRR